MLEKRIDEESLIDTVHSVVVVLRSELHHADLSQVFFFPRQLRAAIALCHVSALVGNVTRLDGFSSETRVRLGVRWDIERVGRVRGADLYQTRNAVKQGYIHQRHKATH